MTEPSQEAVELLDEIHFCDDFCDSTNQAQHHKENLAHIEAALLKERLETLERAAEMMCVFCHDENYTRVDHGEPVFVHHHVKGGITRPCRSTPLWREIASLQPREAPKGEEGDRRVCATEKAGLPTPGYIHARGCKRNAPQPGPRGGAMSEPQNFRKKPVVIAAWQLTRQNIDAVAAWCGGKVITPVAGPSFRWLQVPTLENRELMADMGDWIIKGVKGEFYPCKPDIFEATYEPSEAARSEETKA